MTTSSILEYTQVGRFTVYAVSLVTRLTHAVTLGSQKAQLIMDKLLHIYCMDIFLEIALLQSYFVTVEPLIQQSYCVTAELIQQSYCVTVGPLTQQSYCVIEKTSNQAVLLWSSSEWWTIQKGILSIWSLQGVDSKPLQTIFTVYYCWPSLWSLSANHTFSGPPPPAPCSVKVKYEAKDKEKPCWPWSGFWL